MATFTGSLVRRRYQHIQAPTRSEQPNLLLNTLSLRTGTRRIFTTNTLGTHRIFALSVIDASLAASVSSRCVATGGLVADFSGTLAIQSAVVLANLSTGSVLVSLNVRSEAIGTGTLTTGAAANRPPVASTIPEIVFFEGVPATFDLHQFASDPDGDPFTVQLNTALAALPNHVTYNTSTGILAYDGGALSSPGVADSTPGHIAIFDDARAESTIARRIYSTGIIGTHRVFSTGQFANPFSGHAAGVTTVLVANLTTAISLAASVGCEVTASLANPVTDLAASVTAESTSSGLLTDSVNIIAAFGISVVTASADLTASLPLAASASAVCSAVPLADLTGGSAALAGDVFCVVSATSTLRDSTDPIFGTAFCLVSAVPSANMSGGHIPPIELASSDDPTIICRSRADLSIDRISLSNDSLLFWSECSRCGDRVHHRELVFDGQNEGGLVCRVCWDPKHPQELEYDYGDETRQVVVSAPFVDSAQGHSAKKIYFDENGNLFFS